MRLTVNVNIESNQTLFTPFQEISPKSFYSHTVRGHHLKTKMQLISDPTAYVKLYVLSPPSPEKARLGNFEEKKRDGLALYSCLCWKLARV